MEVSNQSVRNIHSLGLFSKTEIVPVPDEKNEGGWIVEVKLTEADEKSAEVSTEWSIVPGPGGSPSLVCDVICSLSTKFITYLSFKFPLNLLSPLLGFLSARRVCFFRTSKHQGP